MATSKTIPSTRCWARAWLETSMETAWVVRSWTPRSRSAASNRCSSVASGVVRGPVRVPMTRVGIPACSRTAASRWATVVLPLVPVTPAVSRWRDGWEKKAAASLAIEGRAVPGGTRTTAASAAAGSSTGRSHTTPTPPLDRLRGVVVAVDVLTDQAAEQGPGCDPAAVVLDRQHLALGVPRDVQDVDLVEQTAHVHGPW